MLRKRTMMSAAAGEEFVDLGLPSGLLWAKGNLVKDANGNYAIGKETDWGTYVSWGNIIGHNEGEGYNFDLTTYDGTPGKQVAANIPSNDSAHDIALATLGTPWHLPTKEDYQELYDNTDSEWVADYNGTGVAGGKFMKKTNHSVFIFLPASGTYSGTSLNVRGSNCGYWSSSYYSATHAYSLSFSSSSVDPQSHGGNRRSGRTVRPVTLPFAPLSLHFQDGSGNALAGLAVTVTDGNGAHSMTTDASGNIVMNVVKGNVTLASGAYILDITTINVSGDTSAVITGTSVMVDLGLPSGTLWAKGNIVKDANGNYYMGAETDWGTYISWGNIIGHNEGEGYNFDQTTYGSTPGASVNADIPNNDAAHDFALAALGAPLHLPTKEQMQELYDNTDTEWVADYNNTGVAGRKFMKKSDHSVFIFLPASGVYDGTSLSNRGTYGYYWSSSYDSSAYAYYLNFSSSFVRPQSNYYRRLGRTVRPVQ